MSSAQDSWFRKLTRTMSGFFVEPGSDWTQICVDLRTGRGCRSENDYREEFCWKCGHILRHSLKVLKQGAQVDDYRIVDLIGYGSFGAVYEAEDVRRLRRVALKETFHADHIKSYGYEFALLRQLAHPNLPRYEKAFEHRNHGYLVMEFVRGQSLQDILNRQNGPLLESQVMGYALQLCEVLTYLHSQKPHIVHRDIKPDNIRLTPEGLIKLVDFGLLKEGLGHTRSSRLGGTEGYAPLEQYPNSRLHTTPQSDIYSLGATLYHLLTRETPVSAQDRLMALNNPQQSDPLRPPQEHNRHLSAHVTNAIMHAMQLQPRNRYPNVQFFKRALTGVYLPAQPTPLTQPVTARAKRASAAPTRLKRRPEPKPKPKVIRAKGEINLPKIKIPRAGDRMTSPKDGMIMLYVPAGKFLMGSRKDDPDALNQEKPQRKVHLDAFWIDLHPVTNAQFARFVQETGYQTEAEKAGYSWVWNPKKIQAKKIKGANWRQPHGRKSTLSGKQNHPVVCVSWHDAFAYSQWAGRRLPTEAEWEKAARGVLTQEGSRIYPWGNSAPNDKLLNFNMNVGDTTAVGKYPAGASPYGALDMAGNVWEWCADWYDAEYYKNAPSQNPTGPDTGSNKAQRGGSWSNYGERIVRPAFRFEDDPAVSNYLRGFRCVKSVSPYGR